MTRRTAFLALFLMADAVAGVWLWTQGDPPPPVEWTAVEPASQTEISPVERAFRRGLEAFVAREFAASAAAFDESVRLQPEAEPWLWQRGIAQYYAGRYEDCAQQFVVHRSVNPGDVENSIWHFLCVAQDKGVDVAQSAMLPAFGDPRIPMEQILQLYGGNGKPEAVLDAVRRGDPEPAELRVRSFYAHLYLGLWADINGNRDAARRHLRQAVDQFDVQHFMGEVARAELERIR